MNIALSVDGGPEFVKSIPVAGRLRIGARVTKRKWQNRPLIASRSCYAIRGDQASATLSRLDETREALSRNSE